MNREAILICLGQSSVGIGTEIKRLSEKLNYKDFNILCIDNLSMENVQTFMLHLQSCFHIPFDACRVCDQNSDIVIHCLRSFIETIGCCTDITIISDQDSAFGLWSFQLVTDHIRSQLPSVNICSVLRKSIYSSQGVENFYSLMNTFTSFEIARSTLVRGDEWKFRMFDRLTAPAQQTEYQQADVNLRMACDLWFMCVSSESTIQSLDSTVKVFDVRSSLYHASNSGVLAGVCSNGNRKVIKQEYNPLRCLTANIHNLHCCYVDEFGSDLSIFCGGTGAVGRDRLRLLTPLVSKSQFVLSAPRGPQLLGSEACMGTVLTTLNSATPGITWQSSKSNAVGDLNSSNCVGTQLLDDVSVVTDTSATNSSPSLVKPIEGCVAVSSLWFESPYGALDILRTCERTKNLLRVGAYRHL